jgi:alcohol oxidase
MWQDFAKYLLDHHASVMPFLASEDADTLILREEEAQLERMSNFAETRHIRLICQSSFRVAVGSEWQGFDVPQVEPTVNLLNHLSSTLFSLISGFDAGIKIRPNEKDLKDIGPAFEERWKSYFADARDKPVMWIGTLAG